MLPLGCKNMDLESQDPIFNANLGQYENLIWTKKLRYSQTICLAHAPYYSSVRATPFAFWATQKEVCLYAERLPSFLLLG